VKSFASTGCHRASGRESFSLAPAKRLALQAADMEGLLATTGKEAAGLDRFYLPLIADFGTEFSLGASAHHHNQTIQNHVPQLSQSV
jgi:hypothetical protein